MLGSFLQSYLAQPLLTHTSEKLKIKNLHGKVRLETISAENVNDGRISMPSKP